jgi:hypothetical protein
MSQRSRRQDPYPWTWEIPLAIFVAILILVVFGVHGLVDLHGALASPSSLLICVGATELILLAATVVLIKLGVDRWGPGRTMGVATRADAEKLLGVARFRRSRKIVRPDLYGKHRQGVWR